MKITFDNEEVLYWNREMLFCVRGKTWLE